MENRKPDGFQKVFISSGKKCTLNGATRTFIPDDLSLVNAIKIDGEWYVPYYQAIEPERIIPNIKPYHDNNE